MCETLKEGHEERVSLFQTQSFSLLLVSSPNSKGKQTKKKVICIPPGAGKLVILLSDQRVITQRNSAASPGY